MKKLNPHEIGLVVGATVGFMHIVWSLLVAIGWALGLSDFMFSMHFVSNPFVVQSFDWGKAIMLWVITFVAGYLIGWVFGVIWNTLLKKK